MSELDLDIRAVASASFGARGVASDASQAQAAVDTSSSLATTVAETSDSSVSQSVQAGAQPTFRYDSFRFIYQSDYGKIVLIDQNPETGKAVSQIPSQRALQLYADQRRTELQSVTTTGKANGQPAVVAASSGHTLITPTPGGTNVGTGTGTGRAAVSSDAPVSVSTAPAPTPIPASVPAAAIISAAFSPVNITI